MHLPTCLLLYGYFLSPKLADHLQMQLTHKDLLYVALCKMMNLCISQENQRDFEQMLELSINYQMSCWQTVLLLVPY